jgi:hypothetical protein
VSRNTAKGRARAALGLSLLILLAVPPSGATPARQLLVIRPVSVPADTWPGRTPGTFGLKIYNRSSSTLRLGSVRQLGHAPCRVTLRARRLNVRLRPRRWTVVRLRRFVSMRRTRRTRARGERSRFGFALPHPESLHRRPV